MLPAACSDPWTLHSEQNTISKQHPRVGTPPCVYVAQLLHVVNDMQQFALEIPNLCNATAFGVVCLDSCVLSKVVPTFNLSTTKPKDSRLNVFAHCHNRIRQNLYVAHRECRVQDVTVDGTPIDEQSKSKIAADQAAGAVSLLIRIGHKVRAVALLSFFVGCITQLV